MQAAPIRFSCAHKTRPEAKDRTSWRPPTRLELLPIVRCQAASANLVRDNDNAYLRAGLHLSASEDSTVTDPCHRDRCRRMHTQND